ncbi:MAG: hypothetical protein KatS3mg120_1284 [Erythrobacter sp.]|nr:MAG: hypothetical protein KatS3mg120_1284 [Erythrobacter sp.]
MPSSARAERVLVVSSITQSIASVASLLTSACGAGHLATISSYSRAPNLCHSSSVMKGMKGWSITRIWSKAQPATLRVSSAAGLSGSPAKTGLMSSRYQSQNFDQVNW